MATLILNNESFPVSADVDVRGTSENEETVLVNGDPQVNALGNIDRFELPAALSEYEVGSSGNRITVTRDGETILEFLQGDEPTTLAFADGSADVEFDAGQFTLGDATIPSDGPGPVNATLDSNDKSSTADGDDDDDNDDSDDVNGGSDNVNDVNHGSEDNNFNLTSGPDIYSGGGGDDTVAGTVSNQTNRDTFAPGDKIDGGDGTDTLEVELSGSNFNGNVDVRNIERTFIETTDLEPRIFEAEELFNQPSSALEQLWAENISKRGRESASEDDQSGRLLIRDIATSDVTLGVLDSGANVTGVTPSEDPSAYITFEFAEDELSADDNGVGLALDNAQNVAVDINVGPQINGVETLNVNSIQDFPVPITNSLAGVFSGDGNASTMTVTGAAGFKATLASNWSTFDAGGDSASNRATAEGDQTITFLNDGTMTVIGGNGNDTFDVTAGPSAGEKHDIQTGAGDDTVDVVGSAVVTLGEGNDILNGTAADVSSAADSDGSGSGSGSAVYSVTASGGAGDDEITITDKGNHNVDGGAGNDTIELGDGNHTVVGGAGNDGIVVGDGDSTIDAGGGNDAVSVEDGKSDVSLGAGDDTVTFSLAGHLTSADEVDGGLGNDRLIIANGNDTDIGESETLGLDGIDIFRFDGDGVTLKVTDGLIDQADNGFTVEVGGQNGVVDLTALSAGSQVTVNELTDSTVGYDTTIRATDAQLDSKDTFDLDGKDGTRSDDGYDVLEVVDGAVLRPDDLNSFTGLNEILLTVGQSTSQDYTVEPTAQMLNPYPGIADTFTIRVDDDVPANSTLRVDVSEIGPNDLDPGDTLQIVNNGQIDDDEIIFVDETGNKVDQPSYVNVVTGLELTSSSERLDGDGDAIDGNDDTVIASEESDFNNDDIIRGLGQNSFSFKSGGDTLLMQFNPDLLNDQGVAFVGTSTGDDDSNTGFLSQVWGHDADSDDGAATVSGFERIKFDAADVSFVDDVTGTPPTDGDPYSEDNGNISDTGEVVFETADGDDYIQTFAFNSTWTRGGDDVVELFRLDDDGGEEGSVQQNDFAGQAPQPLDGGNPVDPGPFRRHDTGSGNDRVIMNHATVQAAPLVLNMGDGMDVVELRSWDAIFPDGESGTPAGDVDVGPGAFAGDTGLNVLEYASANRDNTNGGNGSPMPTNGTTFLDLNDSDLAAFETVDGVPTAIIRPTSDNAAPLVLDATALTGDNRVDVTGTQFADVIRTGEGDDIINAGGGNDLVESGEGDDTVNGGSGNDDIFTGRGDDTVSGGSGNDEIETGRGDDTVNAGSGDDLVDGQQDDDDITAGDGADTVIGGLGQDSIDVSNVSDSATDTVVYRNENDGSQRGATTGADDVTGFVSGEDVVEIREPMATELDDGNTGNIDFADSNELLMGSGGDGDEAIIFDNTTLSDEQLWSEDPATGAMTADIDAILSDFNTSNSVEADFGDEALIVVHGVDDSLLLHFRATQGPTDSGERDTSVQADEVAILGHFDNALLAQDDLQFG